MIFYLNNESGTGYRFPTKELFLEHLLEAIDHCAADGATYFDVTFESDIGTDKEV